MAVDLAKEVNVEPKKKRAPAVQVHGVNVSSDFISEYWKRAVTIPFLYQLLGQINLAFLKETWIFLMRCLECQIVVVADPSWNENFSRFLTRYKDDLPDFDFLECELRMWRLKCTNYVEPLPANLEELLPCIDELSFPNILTAMRIFGTIPVTTCTCERSISTLRRLKTFMRSTMGQKRLNALALINILREVNIDMEKVIDLFARKHPWRMVLMDLLNSDVTLTQALMIITDY